MICVCQPVRDIDATHFGRLEVLHFLRDEGTVLKFLLYDIDSLFLTDLERDDEFGCFFLGNTAKDDT